MCSGGSAMRAIRVAASVLLLLPLAGCSLVDAGGESLPFGVFEPTGEGAGALLRGELALVGGCLVVKTEDGNVAVWWPSTVSWDEGAQAITVNGTAYRVGDKLEVGGGEPDEPPSGGPDACTSTGRFFIATSP